ncbi:hypothetical protein [Vibrio paucivorans]|uniref:Outer membrane protein beta-barrel domain-containing protein n=1 Tax=Vibrio paucivorans TaxID=2829489 RepID=A0A9X3CH08_9VIBR|nr:hypothetical protein [Vibrio paucivorans]MCW8335264.1 hypothetical protein [Vibrio paucivorans]
MKHCANLIPASVLAVLLFSPNALSESNDVSDAHWSNLPIWGEEVKKLGYELPLPIGLGVYFNNQDVNYVATDDFKVGATGGLLGGLFGQQAGYIVPAEDVSITGQDTSVQLRADAWVFPFLNIYGLLGYTEGNKNIEADLSNATRNGSPFPVPVTIPIDLTYEAYNYGLGAVLASQVDVIESIDPIIVTFSAAYTRSKTTATDSYIDTKIASIRAGQKFELDDARLTVLLGFQYQNISQNVTGTLDNLSVNGISIADELRFDVDITNQEISNLSLMANYDFGPSKRWNVLAEYSFLNWNQLIISAGYRF